LKRTRRIEITAFRRQVTIYSGDEYRINANDPSPSRDESRPNIEANDRRTIDLGEGCDATLDAARAGELSLLTEALIESEGNTSVAARRLGFSRGSFYSQLRKLGLSLRQLKARLKLMSYRRAAKSISDAKARL
jgi:transcriptional regulator of acetoin/glycerol metabolism